MLPEQIKRRLEKLVEFQEGALNIGSQNEAENAAARIQEILIKYNLDMSDIHSGEKIEYIMRKYPVRDYQSKTDGQFIVTLFSCIARNNLCTVLTSRRGSDFNKIIIKMFGTSDNLDIVEYIVDQLIVRIKYMKKRAWKIYDGDEKVNTYTRGYYIGAINGIRTRLEQEMEHFKTDSITSEMILHQTAAVDDFMRELHPNLKTGRNTKISGNDGYYKGHLDGKGMGIRKAIQSNALNQKLIS